MATQTDLATLIDLANRLAPLAGTSSWTILGICHAESNFGDALKPKGAGGSGDFIPRVSVTDRDKRMSDAPLPGVEKKQVPGIPERKITTPVVAWVPTHTGWGCGLFQLDYEAHYEFCRSGAWKEPEKAMAYALGILKRSRETLRRAFPRMKPAELEQATIAAYNAGTGRVTKFLRDGKSLDGATFHPGYVKKICDKADALAGHSGAWLPPQGVA